MPNQKRTIALITTLIACLGTSLSPLTWNNQTVTYTQASTSTNSLPIIEWNATFGLGYYNTAYQIIQTTDGGYAVTGMYGPYRSPLFAALVKYDSNGNLLWNQNYSIRYINYPTSGLIETNDSGFVLVGNQYDTLNLTLVKTDSEGKSQWNKTYSDNCLAFGITQTSDGGYLITGNTAFKMTGSSKAVLLKIDSSGEKQWSKTYGVWYFRAVVQADDGDYVATVGDRLIKVDTSGNVSWEKEFQPTISETQKNNFNDFSALIKTVDGGYVLLGRVIIENKNSSGSMYTLIVKTDASGTIQWNKTYGKSGQVWPYSVVQTSDNGYALAGTAANDMILIKTDEAGNEQWNQTFGDNQDDETAISVIQTYDGGFALAGKIKEGTTFSSGYFYIVKTTSASPTTSTIPPASPSIEIKANPLLLIIAGVVIIVAVCITLIALIKKHRTHSATP